MVLTNTTNIMIEKYGGNKKKNENFEINTIIMQKIIFKLNQNNFFIVLTNVFINLKYIFYSVRIIELDYNKL